MTTVYVLSCWGWDRSGSKTLGVFSSLDLAQAQVPGDWTRVSHVEWEGPGHPEHDNAHAIDACALDVALVAA